MRMPPKRTIRGSGDAGTAEAPEHGVKLETEVVVAADEVSHGQKSDGDGVVLPLPEPEVHNDSDEHSSGDNDSNGELVCHIYPFLVNTYDRLIGLLPKHGMPTFGIKSVSFDLGFTLSHDIVCFISFALLIYVS